MFWSIYKKELNSYFSSPLAYVLIGLFSLISGTIFFNLLVSYSDGIQALPAEMTQQISFVEEVILRLFGNINFLFLFFIPLITMRLFSEEMKMNTIEVYFMAPIKDWLLVLVKMTVAFTLVLAMLIMTCVFPLVMFGAGIQDISTLSSAYLAIFFNALAYISMGVFFSSVSSNQIIAGLLSILGIMFLWMISWGSHLNSNYLISEIFNYIGITSHFERILKGLMGTQDIVYYMSFIIFFFILTTKSLGRRNW